MIEEEARRWAGFSAEEYNALPGTMRWVDPERDVTCKALVIARYQMHLLTEAAIQDSMTKRRSGR